MTFCRRQYFAKIFQLWKDKVQISMRRYEWQGSNFSAHGRNGEINVVLRSTSATTYFYFYCNLTLQLKQSLLFPTSRLEDDFGGKSKSLLDRCQLLSCSASQKSCGHSIQDGQGERDCQYCIVVPLTLCRIFRWTCVKVLRSKKYHQVASDNLRKDTTPISVNK